MRELEIYTYTCLILEAMALDPAAAAWVDRCHLWLCFDNYALGYRARVIIAAWNQGASRDEIAKLLPPHIYEAVMRDRDGVGLLSEANVLDVVSRCAKRLEELDRERRLRELAPLLKDSIKS
jgi:hypothetical protein